VPPDRLSIDTNRRCCRGRVVVALVFRRAERGQALLASSHGDRKAEMTDPIEINLQNWNERAGIHARDATARALISMMAGSTNRYNQRPDTLMQDRTSPDRGNLLRRTAGPYIRVRRGRRLMACLLLLRHRERPCARGIVARGLPVHGERRTGQPAGGVALKRGKSVYFTGYWQRHIEA
jgi:hypothetical protein